MSYQRVIFDDEVTSELQSDFDEMFIRGVICGSYIFKDHESDKEKIDKFRQIVKDHNIPKKDVESWVNYFTKQVIKDVI